jgi:tripartite-type tricarboxylate transporter receptor subunit TctC
VPFPAGGGTDALARWFAKGLEQRLDSHLWSKPCWRRHD